MADRVGLSPGDPNSFSRPDLCIVTHINLDLEIDFESRTLKGYAEIQYERKDVNVEYLILDTRDLTILSITSSLTKDEVPYSLGNPVATFGSKLEIKLPKNESKIVLKIRYATSTASSALQWLKPQQTAGKRYPYLFSQCQAIHARSMLPCQDTPSVKTPYTAKIKAPKDLVVLMSASREGDEIENEKKIYKFNQKVPIPSYLIAIVAGALEGRKIGPRSHVWSEKEYIERAAYEFSQTEEMLSAAESFLGPYVWGIYDLLVLPPSFPFGGMENPCLTFVTPTLLAGDRSLANVVAHEISHSWTGNLVTNRNFEHFWLNEGFTVFVERKIVSRLSGENQRHFAALGGWKELQYSIDTQGSTNPLTKLVPDLRGVDPDDAFSTVPYEKGHTFLYYLEELLGGNEIFERFLRAYIEKFKYKSIDTQIFKDFLLEYFEEKAAILDSVEWDKWFNQSGMPPVKPVYDTSLAEQCVTLKRRWIETTDLSSFTADDLEPFSSGQVIEFLALLLEEKEGLNDEKLSKMTDLYGFKNNHNSEIRFRWLRLGLTNHWKFVIPLAVTFATEQGRMKFVRPIFRDLYAWEETRPLAIETFQKHESEMMHVSAHNLRKDLHLQN